VVIAFAYLGFLELTHYLHHILFSMVSSYCFLHRQNEGLFYISSHNMLCRKPPQLAFSIQSSCVPPSFTLAFMLPQLSCYIQIDIGH